MSQCYIDLPEGEKSGVDLLKGKGPGLFGQYGKHHMMGSWKNERKAKSCQVHPPPGGMPMVTSTALRQQVKDWLQERHGEIWWRGPDGEPLPEEDLHSLLREGAREVRREDAMLSLLCRLVREGDHEILTLRILRGMLESRMGLAPGSLDCPRKRRLIRGRVLEIINPAGLGCVVGNKAC